LHAGLVYRYIRINEYKGVRLKQSIAMTLPEPLSLNRAYRTYKGRMLISKEGREYKKAVAWLVRSSRLSFTNNERLEVCATVYFRDKRRRDLDNIGKLLLDALQDGGMYKDDSQIDDLRYIRAGVDKLNPRVEIVVTEI